MADVELVFPELFPPPPVDEVVPVLLPPLPLVEVVVPVFEVSDDVVEVVVSELFSPPVDEVVPVLEGVIGSVASSYVGSLSASNCSSQTSIRLILKLINSPLKQAQYGFQ